ncbi:MAG: VCBS repeat-containing protein [Anaerolineae bacterium]|nr:VCBS repeat-containing protein [Anaerolineae bacterium]
MSKRWGIMAVILILGLTGCESIPFLSSATLTPTPVPPTATPVLPTATPTPTPLPTWTPTPTPLPTPQPELLSQMAAMGMEHIQAALGVAELVCLRYEDTDTDGVAEWIALVHQPGETARLSAFVLDGDINYPLEPMLPEPGEPDIGLGEYPTCEMAVRDVNADGLTEIAIFGHAAGNKTLLHLYVWDGTGYSRLGDFTGSAGVAFEDADGDLAEEIVVGYKISDAPELARYIIHTWNGMTYGWTSDRYDWYNLDRPHRYLTHKPEYAVASFYLALDDRDIPGAYGLLSGEIQAAQPYETWALGYATTLKVHAGDIHVIPGVGTDTFDRVATMVMAWDNIQGRVVGRYWNVEWDLILTPDGWRLSQSKAQLLREWDTEYWP